MRGFMLRFIKASNHGHGERVGVLAEFSDDYFHLHGLIQRVRRFAQAYLLLEHKSFRVEAHVIARAMMEHSVTGQWVFYTLGGTERLRSNTARDEYNLRVDLGEEAETLGNLRSIFEGSLGMPPWKQIREDLDQHEFLSKMYRILSQVVHVTHSTVLDAVQVDEGRLYLRSEPAARYSVAVLYSVAMSCLLTWWLEAVMTNDIDLQERLHENSHELDMPMRLDHNLPESKRRVAGPDSPIH